MPSPRFIALLVVSIAFAVLSGIAIRDFGYVALWRLPFHDSGTLQLFVDLGIEMVLVTSWMVRDSRTSGVPAMPYLLLALTGGSFGPLGYLLHREWRGGRRPQRRA